MPDLPGFSGLRSPHARHRLCFASHPTLDLHSSYFRATNGMTARQLAAEGELSPMKSTNDAGPAPAEQQNPDARPQSARSRLAKSKRAIVKAANTKPRTARPGSKTSKILNLLQRPNGASVAELVKATGWQPHSVRGFLSGVLKKKMALKIRTAPRDNGDRAYRLQSKS